MKLTHKKFEETLKNIIIQQFGVHECQIEDDSNIVNDFGADSLDMIGLCMACEEEFDIMIPDEDWEREVKTYKSLHDLIESKLTITD